MTDPSIPQEGDWWKVPDLDLRALENHEDEAVRKAAKNEMTRRIKIEQ